MAEKILQGITGRQDIIEAIKGRTEADQLAALGELEKRMSEGARAIVSKPNPTRKEFWDLPPEGRAEVDEYNDIAIASTTGGVRDVIMAYLKCLLPEHNMEELEIHEREMIKRELKIFNKENYRLPTIQELMRLTGYSNTVIMKHLPNPDYNKGCFELLAEAVLSMLASASSSIYVDGTYNVKAARLFLEATGKISGGKVKTINNTQNNYIQINSTILSQQNIENLTPEKREYIEGVITGAIPLPATPIPLETVKNKSRNGSKKR